MLEPEKTTSFLEAAVRSEAAPDETVVWTGRPDTDAMALPLLPFPICWLSGLFLLSAGVLRSTEGDTNRLVPAMIILLIVVAVMGILEIIAVPWQAKRAIYVLTDRRIFVLKLRGRFGDSALAQDAHITRRLVRPEKGTLLNFFCYTVPTHIIFIYILYDLVSSVAKHSDLFVISGVALIVIGWLYQWYTDLRYPLPQLRECPRAFYFINDWLATIETIPHAAVEKTVLHKRKSGIGDIFIIASRKGCMRLKSIPDAEQAYALLQPLVMQRGGKD